jgi:hypothetical protein
MTTGINLSRPTRWLIAANAMLAITVSAELLFPAQPGTANAATTGEVETALPEFGDATVAAPPISQLVDMMERPLFYVDRRIPQPEVEKAAPPPQPKRLRLKLEGIALAGGARVAVLRNLNGNGLLQLAEGESHDGWMLDSLSSTTATFSRDGAQSTELLLDPAGNGKQRR